MSEEDVRYDDMMCINCS